MIITVVLSCLVVLLLIFYLRRRLLFKTCHYLRQLPGPKVSWFWGNIDTVSGSQLEHITIPLLTKKYGKTWIFYSGSEPTIVSSDLDFLQKVFVKEFRNFNGRRQMILQEPYDSSNADLFASEGKRWKRLRMVANPIFTTLKLKSQVETISSIVDTFISRLEKISLNEGEAVDMTGIFKNLTFDIIGACTFGVQFDSLRNPNHDLFFRLKKIFEDDYPKLSFNTAMVTLRALPKLRPFFQKLLRVVRSLAGDYDADSFIRRRIEALVKRSGSRTEDDSNGTFDKFRCRNNALSIMRRVSTQKASSLKSEFSTETQKSANVSDDDLKSLAHLILLAGYETSSSTLSIVTHCLAIHPNYQELLRKEVLDVFGDVNFNGGLPDINVTFYEKLKKLSLMENIIFESLRLYPIVPLMITRRAAADIEIDGLMIKKDTNIMPDVVSVHYDSEIWGPSDPHTFDPSRFDSRRHPAAFMAFGFGPRKCIGARFAIMEIKITLIKLLQNFRILPCKETKIPMEICHGITSYPKSVFIRLEPFS